ncbi:hypothetical protein EGT71_23055 [Atlantibacter subterranea]|uniref:Uncharacterized protein n=1 Tax=Atlantibacter subterraneus TaxID=255519 RepID=A0A427UMF6_9ENTR|nr:hypothetical protein [Atlantibacter subterranea]RSB58477.1 hypothetical protein EGK67_22990 [Atlantibacter subterranea]RSE00724.1 hypothetical protein EGT84_23030 [Atlantibacter subterranea]RSE21641.1 hypothetical protein EGT71_23055 [Atlantibacter subterranea]
MQKVTDLYPPEIAAHKLQNHFSGNTVMLELIQKLNKTSLCTFAALCDGNVVTTSGYNIMADLCVNRASAVAHSLKQKYLPITTRTVSTKADVGGAVKQAAFFIDENDLERLKSEPEKVMKECERNLNRQKQTNAQKEMSRLYKDFGEDGILALLSNVRGTNGTPPPSGQPAS